MKWEEGTYVCLPYCVYVDWRFNIIDIAYSLEWSKRQCYKHNFRNWTAKSKWTTDTVSPRHRCYTKNPKKLLFLSSFSPKLIYYYVHILFPMFFYFQIHLSLMILLEMGRRRILWKPVKVVLYILCSRQSPGLEWYSISSEAVETWEAYYGVHWSEGDRSVGGEDWGSIVGSTPWSPPNL